MTPEKWKTLTTKQIYQNKWMRVREGQVELPNGRRTIYGLCDFGECVGVVSFIDGRHGLMVRQNWFVLFS